MLAEQIAVLRLRDHYYGTRLPLGDLKRKNDI